MQWSEGNCRPSPDAASESTVDGREAGVRSDNRDPVALLLVPCRRHLTKFGGRIYMSGGIAKA
jgi:hypothetical protein